MKVNYHTHSRYCGHAFGEVSDYVESAVENRLEILGLSDHAPFPAGFRGNGMDFSELDSYLADIERAEKNFAGKIRLLRSLEIEYIDIFDGKTDFNVDKASLGEFLICEKRGGAFSTEDFKDVTVGGSYYRWLLEKKGFDYLLLGQHFFLDSKGVYQNLYTLKSPEGIVEYAKSVKRALNTGFFKILAHPDIFAMPCFSWQKEHEEACSIILEAAERNGTILEFNANGLRRGITEYPDGERLQYPHKKFWEKVSNTNIPVVVGADCHEPHQVWDEALEKSYEMLEKLGIKAVFNIF